MEYNPGMSGMAYYVRHKMFDEYKRQRSESGIEEKWRENEDAYNAVFKEEWKKDEGKGWRSRAVVNKTKVKVYAAFSFIIDMLLQGGKIPFTLIPSPLDEIDLDEMDKDSRKEIMDNISDMVSIIEQQFVDCNADRVIMKNVMAAAKYGETWGCRYIDTVVRKGFEQFDASDGMGEMRWRSYRIEMPAPAKRYVSNWNMYWDMESQDIQGGSGLVELEMVSPYDLRLRGSKGGIWILDAIDRCISEADKDATANTDNSKLPPYLRNVPHRNKTIELLKFWGRVPVSVADGFEAELQNSELYGDFGLGTNGINVENDGYEVEVVCYVADNEVVGYARRDGDRPYSRTLWEDSLDESIGNGVADNIKCSQSVLNGMIRAYMDNKALSANVQGVVDEAAVPDWDKSFKPGTMIPKVEGVTAQDVFDPILVPDVGESLLNGIALFERTVDEESKIPRITQGELAPKQRPDTLGELQILKESAGKYLGSVIRNFDETMIEPDVQWFFDYNMMDPNITRGKGNYIAKALGFTSFENRVVRLHKMMQFISLVMSNDILMREVRIRDVLEEVTKMQDLSPQVVLKTPEEKQQEQQAEMEARAMAEEKAKRQIREQMLLDFELERQGKEDDHEHKMEEEELKHEHDLELEEEKTKGDLIKQ